MVYKAEGQGSIRSRRAMVLRVAWRPSLGAGAEAQGVAPSIVAISDSLAVPEASEMREGERAVATLSQQEPAGGDRGGSGRKPDQGGRGAIELRVSGPLRRDAL